MRGALPVQSVQAHPLWRGLGGLQSELWQWDRWWRRGIRQPGGTRVRIGGAGLDRLTGTLLPGRMQQLPRHVLLVPALDPFPIEIGNEIVDVLDAAGSILVIVGMLEHVTGNQGDPAPDGAVLVLVDQDVDQALRIESIVDQQSPAAELCGKGCRFEIGLPVVYRSELGGQRLREFGSLGGIASPPITSQYTSWSRAPAWFQVKRRFSSPTWL